MSGPPDDADEYAILRAIEDERARQAEAQDDDGSAGCMIPDGSDYVM